MFVIIVVETHLWFGGIYNNPIIAYCSRSVPAKEFLKICQ